MKRSILTTTFKLFCLITMIIGTNAAGQAPLQAAQLNTPTLRLIAPSGPQSTTKPINVQVQVTGGQNISGFEFDLIYDQDLVEIVGISPNGFLGASSDCDPNSNRCAISLGPVARRHGTSLGGYSYGNGAGATGDGLLATLHLQPTGVSGSTSLRLADALLATANPVLAVNPVVVPATLNVGGNGSGATTIYLPLILKGTAQPAAATEALAGPPRLTTLPTIHSIATNRSPDNDGDGRVDVVDLARVAAAWGATPTSNNWNPNLDLSGNLVIDEADLNRVADLWKIGLGKIVRTSPLDGERGVAVTRETIIEFSHSLDPATINGVFTARFGNQPLNTRLHLSPDNRRVTLFYNTPLPASTTVEVTLDGRRLRDANGYPVDLNGDGLTEVTRRLTFDTLGLTMVPGTSVCGSVYASERATGSTSDVPLEGATITVDGRESSLRTTTDSTGRFCLDPAPTGRFFAHIDGRTATNNVPTGAYYPTVGKPWEARPGTQTEVGNVYLPLVQPGTLQNVSASADTTINFAPSVIADNPAFAEVNITVPADSLFADSGQRGGQVGIAPVPPDRLPGNLPDGLEFPVVITVQTNGATNFDVPAPVCFPNLPDPNTGETLPPGAKEALYSFNHDTGEWETAGSMTVNEDGSLICSDPGIGIRAPGWHGSGPQPYQPAPPPPLPQFCPAPRAAVSGDYVRAPDVPYETCIERCNADGLRHIGYCTIGAGLGMILCAFLGPAAPACLAPVVAAHWVCSAKEAHDAIVCQDRCDEDCPPSATRVHQSDDTIITMQNETIDQIYQITQQFKALVSPYVMAGQELPPDVEAQANALRDQANAVAGGDVLQYVQDYLLEREERDLALFIEAGETPGNAPPYSVMYMAHIIRADGSGLQVRGQTAADGQYSVFVPRDGTLVHVSFYDPKTNTWGQVHPRRRPADQYRLPRFYLHPLDDSFPDFDADDLPDVVEFVYGTDTNNPDSDGDGISDGAEVEQGSNPLDGTIVQMGVIGGVDTPGFAYDLCIEDDLAVVADGIFGLSLINVADPLNPILVGQLDTPGEAVDVACAGQRAVVADKHGGLLLVDIGNPTAPQLVQQTGQDATLRNPAMAVESDGELAYFDLSAPVFGQDNGLLGTLDVQSGQLRGILGTGRGNKNLSVAGQHLVGLDPREVSVFEVAGGQPSQLGKMTHNRNPYNGSSVLSQVFNTGPLVYMSHFDGYDTLGTTDPRQPAPLGRSTQVLGTYRGIAANGSGRLLAAYSRGPADWALGLFDSSDPTNTDQLLTEFPLPPNAYKVVIYKGLAYIANGDNGLQVVNYLSSDVANVPPVVAVGLGPDFLPGVAPTNQPVSLIATVNEDVQVRQVDFFIDDQPVYSDGSYPFEYRFTTPTPAGQSSLTIRARATDTGGNAGWSDLVTLNLVSDATPPQVNITTPTSDTRLPDGRLTTLSATFSEAIDPASLTATTFQLFDGNDAPINGGAVSYDAATRTARLTLPQPLPLGDYRAVLTTGIRDVAGNALRAEVGWLFSVVTPVRWDGGGDGTRWNDRFNWDTDTRPGANDVVLIDAAGTPTVTLSSPNPIYSLHSDAPLNFQGGTFNIAAPSEFNNAVILDNTTRFGGTGDVVINGMLTWRRAEMFGPGRTIVNGRLDISGTQDKTLSDQRHLEITNTATWREGRIIRGGSGQPAEVSINIRPGATFDIQGDQTMLGTNILFHNEGIVVKSASNGVTTLNATFTNSGLLRVQSGRLNFTNDFIQTEMGTLEVRLGGLTPQTEFDQITVANLVALQGTLDVSLTNGFIPSPGDRFEIVTFSGYLGQFNTINGNGQFYTTEYGPSGVTLVSQN